MRLVFVNSAHPDTPHVSGMRLGFFARELASRGHQVVMLTAPLPGASGGDLSGALLSKRLERVNFGEPVVVSVRPTLRWDLRLVRSPALPAWMRRAATAGQFVAYGGMLADWQVAAGPVARQIAKEFRPNLVWSTFGNTSNLRLAQALAHRAGCPWAMDVKDNWELYVPRGLRHFVAWRFRDARGWTSNAEQHRRVAARWVHKGRCQVIYSGVANEFFDARGVEAGRGKRELFLVGGTYSRDNLVGLLQAVARWVAGLSPADRDAVRFVYAGADLSAVSRAVAQVSLGCETELLGYLSIAELAERAKSAVANMYLYLAPSFHHKLLELLACGRPLITYPGESAESESLASQTRTIFRPCRDAGQLCDALKLAWKLRDEPPASGRPPPWRWSDFAAQLESFFEQCLRS